MTQGTISVLELADPLAEVLGALPPGGRFRYQYDDVVKLAGHSCPTVAGAWLMTCAALGALYSEETPVRGQIEVTLGGPPDDPGLGPMAQVFSLVTGAAGESGFAGLGGRYRRRGLLGFDPGLVGAVRFRRLDSGAAVEVRYSAAAIPRDPAAMALLPEILAGRAQAAERARFAAAWQARVDDLLGGDPARVLTLRAV
jgi:hypothetical protein